MLLPIMLTGHMYLRMPFVPLSGVCTCCGLLCDSRASAPCVPLDGACGPAGRAEALRKCCSNVDVKLLNAGHCPHDEAPAAVNEALLEFLSARSVPSPAQAPS